MSSTVVIFNPKARGGKAGKERGELRRRIEARLGPVQMLETEYPRHATDLVRQSLKDGAERIIAVGGDGTINEVVNGFFEDGTCIGSHAALGLIPFGTGDDFRKTIGIGDTVQDAIGRIAAGRWRPLDVGRLTCIGHDGTEVVHHFDNISSFGLGGAVMNRVNNARIARLFGNRFTYAYHSMTTALTYKPQEVVLKLDDGDEIRDSFTIAAICNGQYFAAGTRVAPDADPGDGLFDVVTIGAMGVGDFTKNQKQMADGSHLNDPRVHSYRAAKVEALPIEEKPVLIELDGETPGKLPATFEILPQAIRLFA